MLSQKKNQVKSLNKRKALARTSGSNSLWNEAKAFKIAPSSEISRIIDPTSFGKVLFVDKSSFINSFRKAEGPATDTLQDQAEAPSSQEVDDIIITIKGDVNHDDLSLRFHQFWH